MSALPDVTPPQPLELAPWMSALARAYTDFHVHATGYRKAKRLADPCPKCAAVRDAIVADPDAVRKHFSRHHHAACRDGRRLLEAWHVQVHEAVEMHRELRAP